jgi:3-hydroxyacyl-CoA dehydrogenase / enoyl-CoA hydratase / 3-hydroxybutyryl-CoA epimerase
MNKTNGIVLLPADELLQPGSLANAVDSLCAEADTITGVIVTLGAKNTSDVGDAGFPLAARDPASVFAHAEQWKAPLRQLEQLGRPVVAAIGGGALGAALEIALACHHRIALDATGTLIGLPQASVGLIPAGGGIIRTVRMLGLQKALMDVLLRGQQYRPAQALAVGLVDELAASEAEMMAAAGAWIRANPHPAQPWDEPDFQIPGGAPGTPALDVALPGLVPALRRQTRGASYPALTAILAAAVEGAQVDVDTALRLESRHFTSVALDPVGKNMMQAFLRDLPKVEAGDSRPHGFAPHAAHRVFVLGAGMMGAGIAYACARAGLDVVLADLSLDSAQRGKDYSLNVVARAVAKDQLTRDQGDALLARITPAGELSAAVGADLVIEAVFEDSALKQRLFSEIEPLVAADAVLASNTSTLPITGLAASVRRQDAFIGMHFFSPVDKMVLLEIVAGKRTSDATLARAIDIARQIGKTPIVVNDSRGFFTSRIISKYLDEAIAMVGEGLDPSSIEQAGLHAGYPAGPLQLLDELTLTLPRKIREEAKAATVAAGGAWTEHGSEPVLDRLIDEFGRQGRASGAGFYDYANGKRAGLWPGLRKHFTKPGYAIPFDDMKERMLFVESVDTVRCLDEGVLRSVPEANVGSILGIGFPAWTGGVLQYINTYAGGPAGFTQRAYQLARDYGPRSEPPPSLVELAESGGYYGDYPVS